jgi:hypothetical protein
MAEAKAQETTEEGDLYVWSTGHYYAKPHIDAKKIMDTRRNYAVKGNVKKLKSTLFADKYTLEILDPEREPDVELSARLMNMFEAAGVRLWNRMQLAYDDDLTWDISIMNQVWEWVDNEYVLTRLRRLSPRNFENVPSGGGYRASADILQGICLNEKGEMEYWHDNGSFRPGSKKQLDPKNLFIVRDPQSTELPGDSDVATLAPVVTRLNFAQVALGQLLNRVGSPTIFIKITDPQKGDKEYADKLLKNWGKDSVFQLRSNMEPIDLKIQDNGTALRAVDKYEGIIKEYFKPSSLLQREGATIGGNAAAEADLYSQYARGVYTYIEDAFEVLPQIYLEANGFEGYTAQFHIGKQAASIDYINTRIAEVGTTTRTMTVNEVRGELGKPAMTPEQIAAMAEEWDLVAPAAAPVDPYAMINAEPTSNAKALERELRKAGDRALEDIVKEL